MIGLTVKNQSPGLCEIWNQPHPMASDRDRDPESESESDDDDGAEAGGEAVPD